MPKHRSENAIIPDGVIPGGEAVPEVAREGTAPVENAWVEFERGRLSRRRALKKLGMTSAMATFALFSVDDLAHMVGKAMQQRAGDNKVAAQVAQELHQAGIVLADGTSHPTCIHCCNQYCIDRNACYQTYCTCVGPNCDSEAAHCLNNSEYDFNGCYNSWCGAGIICPTCIVKECPPPSTLA